MSTTVYTEYYGLAREPFENTPDPDFLFLSKKHREILASLVYGVNFGKGFILVAGDVGMGKTTLIHALLRQIDSSFLLLHIINPRSTFGELLRHLAEGLGLPLDKEGNLELMETVRQKLDAVNKDGRRVVLIIDEAHHLSEESLEDIRLLSNIETEKHKLIQIVLVGQIELHEKLERDSLRPLKQRVVINRTLEPLDKRETIDYVNHRLSVAGRSSVLFDRSALSLIWRKSRGIPRVINQLCDNALLIGFAIQARSIGSTILREVIEDMEGGHAHRKARSNLFYDQLKWIGPATAAVILIVYLGARSFIPDLFPKAERPQTMTTVPQSVPLIQDKKKEASVAPQAQGDTSPSFDSVPKGDRHASTQRVTAEEFDFIPMTNSVMDIDHKQSHSIEHNLSTPANAIDGNRNDPADAEMRVNPKDYLFRIGVRNYGIANDTIIDFIHMANPNVKNVNQIHPGQKIILPRIERKDLIVKDNKGRYYIHYASFYSFEDAKNCVQRLFEKKQTSFLISTLQGDNLVYRIYFGIFDSHEDAETNLRTLALDYLPFLDKDKVVERSAE